MSIHSDDMDVEVCDRCGHVVAAHLVKDTLMGLYCRDCRRALGVEAEDEDIDLDRDE
jgi:late competence protein required for DNA uptake (superfamily II DNA/RNA helicase)